eukprot:2795436-Amphidinium_carterae.1
MKKSFHEALAEMCVPPNLFTHPIYLDTTSSNELVLPLALYIDGVQYTEYDTLTNIQLEVVLPKYQSHK